MYAIDPTITLEGVTQGTSNCSEDHLTLKSQDPAIQFETRSEERRHPDASRTSYLLRSVSSSEARGALVVVPQICIRAVCLPFRTIFT